MKRLKKEFFEMINDDERIVTVDHQGSFASTNELFGKVEWLTKGMECDIVVIDPIQAAVPDNSNGEIESFMDQCLKVAKQTEAHIFVVSHVKKPESEDPHQISEYMIKGSTAINQIAFQTILLSRDKMAEDERIRNSTRIQLAKCRRTGETGEAGWLRFIPEKAKLIASDNPYNSEYEPEEDVSVFDSSDSGEQLLSEKAEGF